MLVPRSGQFKLKHYYNRNLYVYQSTNSMRCGMAVANRKGGNCRSSQETAELTFSN